MYIKNRRNSNKIKAFGSCQALCLTENLVLSNRLLFIYETLCPILQDTSDKLFKMIETINKQDKNK